MLAGSLGAPESGAAPSVIFGTTLDNQRVTLMQPSLRSWGGTHDRRGQERRNREEWGTFDVLVGGHFRAGASTEFNTIEFTTDHLAHWVARPRPTIDHVADEGRSVSVSLEIQEPVRSTFSGAEVNVEWSESANYGTVAATAVLEPRFVVRVPEGITLEAAWDVYITPLLFLMTLATGSAQSIRSLNAGQAARQPWRSSRASVLPNRWGNVPDLTGDARHWEFPLPFHQIEPRFAEVVPSWLELFGNERLALVEFFSVPFTPGLFLEDSFARTVRAIELWHRGRHGGEWMSPQEFEELRAKFKSGFSPKEREFLNMRLQFGNEWTLKQRLDAMLGLAGSPMQQHLALSDRFARRVVNRRNQLTHGTPTAPNLGDEETAWAERALQGVFYSVLLRALGFDEAYVRDALMRSSTWSWVQRIPESLLPKPAAKG